MTRRRYRRAAAGCVVVLELGIAAACANGPSPAESTISPDASRSAADAFVSDRPEPLDAPVTPGTFGHCCVGTMLFSCFCPADASCHFGTACADGGCVEGDGTACNADGAVEAD